MLTDHGDDALDYVNRDLTGRKPSLLQIAVYDNINQIQLGFREPL
jgi:hypothetical protein